MLRLNVLGNRELKWSCGRSILADSLNKTFGGRVDQPERDRKKPRGTSVTCILTRTAFHVWRRTCPQESLQLSSTLLSCFCTNSHGMRPDKPIIQGYWGAPLRQASALGEPQTHPPAPSTLPNSIDAYPDTLLQADFHSSVEDGHI